MYSYIKTPDDPGILWYYILDPDGDKICCIVSKGEAEALISHLNRE